jgi:hypothetical protein
MIWWCGWSSTVTGIYDAIQQRCELLDVGGQRILCTQNVDNRVGENNTTAAEKKLEMKKSLI